MPTDSVMFINPPRSEEEAMDTLIDCIQKSNEIALRTRSRFHKDTKAALLLNELAEEGYVIYVQEILVEGNDADYWDEEAARIERIYKKDAVDDALGR